MINKGDFYQKIKERKIELRERDSSFPKWSWMPKYRGTVELLSLMALPILTFDSDDFGMTTEVSTAIVLRPHTLLTGRLEKIGDHRVLYNLTPIELNYKNLDRMDYSLYPMGEKGDKIMLKQLKYLHSDYRWHIQVNVKDYNESWVLLK